MTELYEETRAEAQAIVQRRGDITQQANSAKTRLEFISLNRDRRILLAL